MPHFTKVLANVGPGSPSFPGNTGFSGKYYPFTYFVTGLPAAVTSVPIGVAPTTCKCVGVSCQLTAGTAATTNVTMVPRKTPHDTGVAVDICSTNPVFGTAVVAFPAFTSTVNFDGSGFKTTAGSNGTASATGITHAAVKTNGDELFRQGDMVSISTSGTFTGAAGLLVTVWLQEMNGAN